MICGWSNNGGVWSWFRKQYTPAVGSVRASSLQWTEFYLFIDCLSVSMILLEIFQRIYSKKKSFVRLMMMMTMMMTIPPLAHYYFDFIPFLLENSRCHGCFSTSQSTIEHSALCKNKRRELKTESKFVATINRTKRNTL